MPTIEVAFDIRSTDPNIPAVALMKRVTQLLPDLRNLLRDAGAEDVKLKRLGTFPIGHPTDYITVIFVVALGAAAKAVGEQAGQDIYEWLKTNFADVDAARVGQKSRVSDHDRRK